MEKRRSFSKRALDSLKKVGKTVLKNYVLIPTAILAGSLAANAQQAQYGDLELTVMRNGNNPAPFVQTKAVDPDVSDTTIEMTNVQGIAYYNDLYVYTTTHINDIQNKKAKSLEGVVDIFNLAGQKVDQRQASNGTILWKGNNSAATGVYIARDEKGTAIKFLYVQQPTRLGQKKDINQPLPFKSFSMLDDTTNLYELYADGRFLELEPFDVTMDTFRMQANMTNYYTMTPTTVADGPAWGQIEILINGSTPCGDGASVKLVRPGQTDTVFLSTVGGVAVFDSLAGVTSHPFGNFTREYLSLISGEDFLSQTDTLDMALGGGNNFVLTPDTIPEQYANGPVTVWNGTTPTPNVDVDMWRLVNPVDTFSYVTNTAGTFFYENIPVNGPTDYVFSSFKDDGVNPVLTSLDTATLVNGTNPLINIYLEQIPQFFHWTGSVREFYNQSQLVQGVGMFVRDANTGATIDSTGTDANGEYHLSNIPAGLQAEIVMVGLANHFNRIHEYTFPAIVQTYADTLLADKNMLHVPLDFIIPQTDNDPAPATLVADTDEVAEIADVDGINGEEIARFENRIYLTNFGAASDSAFYHAAEQAIDSLFYGGEGSPLILVPNQINITPYHQQNYNVYVGFPGQLGWNVTRGGGNITTPIHSTVATGYYILGGQINITGDLADRIKELQGRRLQLGDVTSRPSFMNPTNAPIPDDKDRAYVNAILINHDAHVMTGYEIFPLNGLSTTLSNK